MSDELVFTGRVATLSGNAGFGWVDALAIRDGRVVAAGSRSEAVAAVGASAPRFDLGQDHVAVPGMTDAHLHLASAALATSLLDLVSATGLDDVLARIAAAHAERAASGDRDGWLLGRGWSLDQLGGWPKGSELEAAAPGRPVFLDAYDGHGVWASPAALRAAGVDARTKDPPGGVVLRDASGAPSGVLLEAAVELLDHAVPVPDDDAVSRALEAYGRRLLAAGIVACHDPGESWADPLRFVHLFPRLAEEGRLPMRAVVSVREHELDAAIEAGLRSGGVLLAAGSSRARFGWLKLFADGTLGSRTAAMLDPYLGGDDHPAGDRGSLTTEPAELSALAQRAATAGIATQVHAIGDRAVQVAVDVLELLPGLPLRPRVEHAQAIAREEVDRMASAGITASVQPNHLRADAPKARLVWADRLHRAYAFRTMAARGVRLAFGSDAPIEPADAWGGLSLAVTRRHAEWDADGPIVPAEALDVATALRAACSGPADSAADNGGGRLVRGSRADLVVVAAGALRADGSGLAGTTPVLTLVDGREAWRDEAWDREPRRS
jgi:hypothetical protein